MAQRSRGRVDKGHGDGEEGYGQPVGAGAHPLWHAAQPL